LCAKLPELDLSNVYVADDPFKLTDKGRVKRCHLFLFREFLVIGRPLRSGKFYKQYLLRPDSYRILDEADLVSTSTSAST